MKKIIYAVVDYITGCKFKVGQEKEGIFSKLDEDFENADMVVITLGSPAQLVAAELYAKKHNYTLKVRLQDGGLVEGEDLCKAHYEVNKEYIDLANELDELENLEDEENRNERN